MPLLPLPLADGSAHALSHGRSVRLREAGMLLGFLLNLVVYIVYMVIVIRQAAWTSAGVRWNSRASASADSPYGMRARRFTCVSAPGSVLACAALLSSSACKISGSPYQKPDVERTIEPSRLPPVCLHDGSLTWNRVQARSGRRLPCAGRRLLA
jgi:hypothetical protein